MLGPAYPFPHARSEPRRSKSPGSLALAAPPRGSPESSPLAGQALGDPLGRARRQAPGYHPSPRLPAALPALRQRARSPVTDLQKPPVPFTLPRAHTWLSRDSAPCAGNAPGALYLHVGNKKRKAGQVLTTFDNAVKGRNRLGAGAGPSPFQAAP